MQGSGPGIRTHYQKFSFASLAFNHGLATVAPLTV